MSTQLATTCSRASALLLLAVGALSACRTPATPPEPPPTETKPAAGAESRVR